MRVRASSVPHLTNYRESGGVYVNGVSNTNTFKSIHYTTHKALRITESVKLYDFDFFVLLLLLFLLSIIEINFRLLCALFCSLKITRF